jgi:hypothetical protein
MAKPQADCPVTFCPDCGKNLALVGRVHRCIPTQPYTVSPQVNNAVNKTVGEKVIDGLKEAVEIAQGKREPAQVTLVKVRNRQSQAKWRDENIDTNRQRAREGMRKARAKANKGK